MDLLWCLKGVSQVDKVDLSLISAKKYLTIKISHVCSFKLLYYIVVCGVFAWFCLSPGEIHACGLRTEAKARVSQSIWHCFSEVLSNERKVQRKRDEEEDKTCNHKK